MSFMRVFTSRNCKRSSRRYPRVYNQKTFDGIRAGDCAGGRAPCWYGIVTVNNAFRNPTATNKERWQASPDKMLTSSTRKKNKPRGSGFIANLRITPTHRL